MGAATAQLNRILLQYIGRDWHVAAVAALQRRRSLSDQQPTNVGSEAEWLRSEDPGATLAMACGNSLLARCSLTSVMHTDVVALLAVRLESVGLFVLR